MTLVALDDADNFLLNLGFGDAGVFLLDKVSAVKLDDLKIAARKACLLYTSQVPTGPR